MELQFLGTGAAEGIPSLFTRNERMDRIRREQGADLRTRSALRIGEHYQIDFGPDAFFQSIRCGCDFFDLEHLIITHMHSDHFQLEGVLGKEMALDANGKQLALYASIPAVRWLRSAITAMGGEGAFERHGPGGTYPIVQLDYFSKHVIGELTVHTIRGNHRAMTEDERPINPLITLPGGERMLYAVDTGYYEEETWEFLADFRVDLLIMEATFGGRTDRPDYPSGHLDAFSFVRQVERMASIGFLDEHTPIFATHINPKHPWDHADLQAFFDDTDFSITVGRDCQLVSL